MARPRCQDTGSLRMVSTLFLLITTNGLSLPILGDVAARDLVRLQGEWVLVRMEVGGKDVPPERLSSAALLMHGRRYRLMTRNQTFEVEITLDPAKTPKEIDMTFLDGPNQDRTGKGIYRIEGNRWIICRSLRPEDDRPKEFTSEEVNYFIMVWERK